MKKNQMKIVLIIAGIYNILWGAWAVFFPFHAFELAQFEVPRYPQLWQCIGMIVGVYGVGYFIAAFSPLRHWPIVLVGLMGKVFGPIGFIWSIYQDIFPLGFGWNIIFNDLIWWVPFFLILSRAFKESRYLKQNTHLRPNYIKQLGKRKRAKLINSLSGYKSANLIGTINNEGVTNLSIVSSVFHLGANPALVGMILRPDTVRRDTLENIRSNGFFTINHVAKSFYPQAHQTSARYDLGESEFTHCNLEEEYLSDFKAPFVKESPIKFSVELIREEKIEENGTHFILGSIKDIYAPKDCLEEDGGINLQKAQVVCLSGLDKYYCCDLLAKLSYAKPNEELKSLV